MIPDDLIADLRSRINPAYAAQPGSESYERRLCAEALEAARDEIDRLRYEKQRADVLAATIRELRDVVTHDGETKADFIARVRDILLADPDARVTLTVFRRNGLSSEQP